MVFEMLALAQFHALAYCKTFLPRRGASLFLWVLRMEHWHSWSERFLISVEYYLLFIWLHTSSSLPPGLMEFHFLSAAPITAVSFQGERELINSQWKQAGVCYSLLSGLARNWSVLHTNDGFVSWHLSRQRELDLRRWRGETDLERGQTQCYWCVALPALHGQAGQLCDFSGGRPGGVLTVVSWLGA